jgi:hypothetical protein
MATMLNIRSSFAEAPAFLDCFAAVIEEATNLDVFLARLDAEVEFSGAADVLQRVAIDVRILEDERFFQGVAEFGRYHVPLFVDTIVDIDLPIPFFAFFVELTQNTTRDESTAGDLRRLASRWLDHRCESRGYKEFFVDVMLDFMTDDPDVVSQQRAVLWLFDFVFPEFVFFRDELAHEALATLLGGADEQASEVRVMAACMFMRHMRFYAQRGDVRWWNFLEKAVVDARGAEPLVEISMVRPLHSRLDEVLVVCSHAEAINSLIPLWDGLRDTVRTLQKDDMDT